MEQHRKNHRQESGRRRLGSCQTYLKRFRDLTDIAMLVTLLIGMEVCARINNRKTKA